ncbi:MAG: (2Fe-2S)-binding protein [Bdellovibrionales bacterium]|nr:(2Fe-2S)-binding protein [Bdellovibrionales bacterium]
MAKIQFLKGFSEIQLSNPENLMQTLRKHNIPVASSCGGEGICGKCQVKVINGEVNLSAKRKLESDCLIRNGVHEKNVRLSCQCTVMGDVQVDTNYW